MNIYPQTDTALIYDAVQVFARALSDLDISQHISVEPVPCDGGHAWQHGNSLLNYMKMVSNAQCALSSLQHVQ